MFASLAELERDNIVERTTSGRNARGRKDGERGGRLPMGYTRTESGIEIEPAGAEVVRSIFTQRVEGATLTAIAIT
jgi:site-specific DNA recombinase